MKSGNKFVVAIPLGMQGIIKAREKRVESNYPGHINMPVIFGARPSYHAPLSLVSISLYLSYLSCLSYEKSSYNTLYLSFLLYRAVVREVSIKLYLSYDFFSYDRHDRYDRYNDMETRLKLALTTISLKWKVL